MSERKNDGGVTVSSDFTATAENCLPLRATHAEQRGNSGSAEKRSLTRVTPAEPRENAKRVQNRTLTRETEGGGADDPEPALDVPTIGRDLTRCERALLGVLLDPAHFSTTTAQRASAAGISVRTYGSIMRKPDFQLLVCHAYRTALREHIGDVLQAAVDTAAKPGRDGHQDRAMILQMAGMHVPKQQVDLRAGAPIIGIVGISLDDI